LACPLPSPPRKWEGVGHRVEVRGKESEIGLECFGNTVVVRNRIMASENATKKDVEKVDNRLTGIVDKLNEINENMKIYVDEADEAQSKTLNDIEKRLSELIDTKVKNYDKLVRKVVVEEFAKIGK
jgi:hypothetical protein